LGEHLASADDALRPAALGKVKNIHFVGIGGSGMSGIAEVMLNQGYAVSGSDLLQSATIAHLEKMGADVTIGHSSKAVGNSDVLVVSSAVDSSNPEIIAAHQQRIPVIARAEMLGELMRYKHGIAIAGTHGKTTTTSLIASIFQAAGLDPTVVIGGLLNSAGSNAQLGTSQYFIAEADESDASFLHLQPLIAVITNIDRDHISTYAGDFLNLQNTFLEFTHRLPFYGTAVVCIDDVHVVEILPRISRPTITYGFSEQADVRATDVRALGRAWEFTVLRRNQSPAFNVMLPLPGNHNVLNALAAIAVALEEGISDAAINLGLKRYAGVGRRFETHEKVRFKSVNLTLVDDYGHHPTEVDAVIETARAVWPDNRLVLIFQPHRYSRTQDLFDDFLRVLSKADALVMLPVYSAGETPIAGADSRSLARGIRERSGITPVNVESLSEVMEVLPAVLRDGDVVLVQGAGNVNQIKQRILEVDDD